MKRSFVFSWRRPILPCSVLAACAALCLCGCKPKLPPAGPPEVQFVPATPKDVPVYREWVGSTDGSSNATIRAQVSGYIIHKYQEGHQVNTGDLLFEIDPRPFEAVLGKAKATLAQAVAHQEKTALDVKRYTPLAKEQAISQQELDDAIQANLGAEAQVEEAKAALQQAQLNLDFTRILAPIPGRVGISNVDVGDLVSPGSGNLTTLSTMDPIKVNFFLSEQEYLMAMKLRGTNPAWRPGEQWPTLELVLADGSTFPHEGHISTVDREVDQKTGTIHIQGLFPNPDAALRPGLFVRVRALLRTRPNALTVPQRAVMELQGRYQVAVVGADNKISIRPVKVGERFGSDWLIEEGVAPGERVVVEGVQKAREGVTVIPKPFTPETPGSPPAGAQPGSTTQAQAR